MNLLIPVFANYYTNYALITEEESERFATIVYIVAAIAAAVFVLHLLYGFFAKMAHIKRNFIEYYQKENIKRPRFHFWYYWTKPCFNPDNRTLWSFAGEIWKKDYIFNTIGEYFKVKRNIYDVIALPLRGILLILVWVVMILSFFSEFSDGDSGDSFSGSFKGGHGSGRSGGRSGGGMGRGGGGRSGGGFGGRR